MKNLFIFFFIFWSPSVFSEIVLGEIETQNNPNIQGCGDYLFNKSEKLVFAYPLSTELGYFNLNGHQFGLKPGMSEYVYTKDKSTGKLIKTTFYFGDKVKVIYEVSKFGHCDDCDPSNELKGSIIIWGNDPAEKITVEVTGYSGC